MISNREEGRKHCTYIQSHQAILYCGKQHYTELRKEVRNSKATLLKA